MNRQMSPAFCLRLRYQNPRMKRAALLFSSAAVKFLLPTRGRATADGCANWGTIRLDLLGRIPKGI